MHENDIDFEGMTIEKLIDLVFTEMVYRKIQQLEEETLSKKLLNHDVMCQGIIEACKILKYTELSEIHRDYFEALFDMSYFVWFQIFSKTKRTLSTNNLIDYIICVCK